MYTAGEGVYMYDATGHDVGGRIAGEGESWESIMYNGAHMVRPWQGAAAAASTKTPEKNDIALSRKRADLYTLSTSREFRLSHAHSSGRETEVRPHPDSKPTTKGAQEAA